MQNLQFRRTCLLAVHILRAALAAKGGVASRVQPWAALELALPQQVVQQVRLARAEVLRQPDVAAAQEGALRTGN
jgi:hypothetical protein